MNWKIDRRTQLAAAAHPLARIGGSPIAQFSGRPFNPKRWNRRVIQPNWPEGELGSSPEQIVAQFRDEEYLQALARVVSWGTMWRRSRAIWGDRELATIEDTLRHCARSIRGTQSIEDSWVALTGRGERQLGWSPVITSKTLHFLCRSLGFEQDPPVAVDNAVILNRVWPAFRDAIPSSECPEGWRGGTFEAYCRYMTAMLTWADLKKWTTTQMEATVFAEYRKA